MYNLPRNLRCVCKIWGVLELQLWSKWKSEKMSIFSKDNIEEYEHVTEMIIELFTIWYSQIRIAFSLTISDGILFLQ